MEEVPLTSSENGEGGGKKRRREKGEKSREIKQKRKYMGKEVAGAWSAVRIPTLNWSYTRNAHRDFNTRTPSFFSFFFFFFFFFFFLLCFVFED